MCIKEDKVKENNETITRIKLVIPLLYVSNIDEDDRAGGTTEFKTRT